VRIAATAAVILVATAAAADPVVLHLSGEGCDATELSAALEPRLPASADDLVNVRIGTRFNDARIEARVVMTSRFEEVMGKRDIEVADCDELAEAVSLIVRMVVSQPRTPPQAKSPTLHSTPPTQEVADDAAAKASSIGLVASAGLTTDGLPAYTLGARVQEGKLALQLELETTAPEEQSFGSGHVTIRHYSGRLSPCVAGIRFSVCAVFRAGWVDGVMDLPTDMGRSGVAASAGANVGIYLQPPGPLRLRAFVEALGALASTSLRYSDGETWSAPLVEGRIGFALEASFL
jgi:hypothetical protein